MARLKAAQRALAETADVAQRIPYFCSGCPHNTSTRVPEGSRAYAGIGCHYMSQWMDRKTLGYTQMGGEGANWIGEAPFSKREHVFQNLGDGTYNHSGYLAIRAAIASGVTMTYKILFNDAVAMTGGQANEGGLTVPQIAAQVAAEGAKRVVVVTDEPWKYPKDTEWPRGLTIHHREELDAIQRELATVPGVTVLIYDQTCAAEKRRRRKRGAFPDPDKRVVINDLVCEGCGDCGVQIELRLGAAAGDRMGPQAHHRPVELQQGLFLRQRLLPVLRHRARRQAQEGRERRRARRLAGAAGGRACRSTNHPYGIIVTGIGGTGIVTIGAILGMAAHLEGKGVGIIDMAGLAQKGGAVFSHIRIANKADDIHAIRVAAGGADLVLGGDIVVAGTKKVLSAIKPGNTHVVVNTAEFLPGDFTRNADFSLPTERLKRAISGAAGRERSHFVDAGAARHRAARQFDRRQHVHARLRLSDRRAAALGRGDREGDRDERRGGGDESRRLPLRPPRRRRSAPRSRRWSSRSPRRTTTRSSCRSSFDETVDAARRIPHRLSERALRAALPRAGREDARGRSRARARAMRARRGGGALSVQADGLQGRIRGRAALHRRQFRRAGEVVLRRRPALRIPSGAAAAARKDQPATGEPKKMSFGPWMLKAFGVLAKFKFLRGTPLDPFGYTAERRTERKLIADYEALLATIAAELTPANHPVAVALAAIPEKIRGFGPVKQRHLAAAKAEEAALRAAIPGRSPSRFSRPRNNLAANSATIFPLRGA